MGASGFMAVGIGAALGAWLRWGLGFTLNAVLPNLPLGTLAANVIGGYLVGGGVGYFFLPGGVPVEVRLFLVYRFLCGLATFSFFSASAVGLLVERRSRAGVLAI